MVARALLAEAVRKPVLAHEFLDSLLAAEISGRESRRVITNKSVRDWTGLLAGDEVLATAILESWTPVSG